MPKVPRLSIVFLLLLSILFMGDSLLFKQQPANMDGVVHVTNIAIFHSALRNGEFPVRWTDSFANYGLPMGSFSQQMTSYLGAFFTFLTHDVVTAFDLVLLTGTFFSLLFFYLFLRLYFSEFAALSGAVLFNFTNFRIINAHIRGALPEFFSSVFVALLLIGMGLLLDKKKVSGFYISVIASFGLVLTHPMNVVTSTALLLPILGWLCWKVLQREGTAVLIKRLSILTGAVILGLVLSAYYVVPLMRDIRFLNYGSSSNHFNPNQELTVSNFFDPNWYYFDVATNNILSRGHIITVGVLESVLLIGGVIYLIARSVRTKGLTPDLLTVAVFSTLICVFLVTKYSAFLYHNVDLLSNIQFQWRMLSSLLFIPPILLAFFVEKINKQYSLILVVFIVLTLRAPQLYGKNYTNFDQDYYYSTIENLHTANMNTIWTEETTSYSSGEDKVAVLEGNGGISSLKVHNSKRTFTVTSDEGVRMIDRTFYFPGWNVYVDGESVPIEFQDILYRGVITYRVPAGTHDIEVVFQNTKTTTFANAASLTGLAVIILIIFLEKKYQPNARFAL